MKENQLTYHDYLERIRIQDVLNYAGYKLNKRDGIRYPSYVRLDSGGRRVHGDKFVVMPGGNTCFRPPVQQSYNVISLIKNFPELFPESAQGKSGAELVNAVCRHILDLPAVDRADEKILEAHRDAKPFTIKDYSTVAFSKYDMDTIKKFCPYFKSRAISIDTQTDFARSFVLASKDAGGKTFTNLSFPLRIPGKSAIVGFEERGRCRLDGSSGYKGKALGSNSSEGLWIASPGGTPLNEARHVLWFESAYDAMAYYQLRKESLQKTMFGDRRKRDGIVVCDPQTAEHCKEQLQVFKDAVYLSTGGNPTVMQFRGVIKEAKAAAHHLCFDNDMAGRQFVMNFQAELAHVRQSLPKVSADMKEYMATLSNEGDWLSGDADYLPNALYKAYGAYYDEAEELMSMKAGGVSYEGDIKEQEEKVRTLYDKYKRMMSDKLAIGSELGHLKDLGKYDVPEWALCAMEEGDYEGLTEEETTIVNDFIAERFPDGFIMDVDWDNPNEFNVTPDFGTRNTSALTSKGESPYEAVKTYPVHFIHPTERDGVALPDVTVVREIPDDGKKDWNDQLRANQATDANREETKTLASGVDLDNDGEIEIQESEERKYHRNVSR